MTESADNATENPKPAGELPADGLQVGGVVRVGRLNSLKHARAELGRLYREARRREGRYPTAITAMRLANVLATLRESIVTDELAERLDALEAAQQLDKERRDARNR